MSYLCGLIFLLCGLNVITVSAQKHVLHTPFIATGATHGQIGLGYNFTLQNEKLYSFGFAVSSFYLNHTSRYSFTKTYGLNGTLEGSYGNVLKAGLAVSIRSGDLHYKAFCTGPHCNDDTYSVTEICPTLFLKYQPFNKRLYLRFETVPQIHYQELLDSEKRFVFGFAAGYTFQKPLLQNRQNSSSS